MSDELLLQHTRQRSESLEVAGHALVTTATSGSMISRYRAISPGRLAPASTTSASVSAGASRIVSGTPTRLLRLARVA